MHGNGMHGSVKILDALSYAKGYMICRVDITGDIIKGEDKIVGRNRKVLWIINGKKLLRKFARKCALDVIDNWDAPMCVREWLKTGNEKYMSAAWSAADSAAGSAPVRAGPRLPPRNPTPAARSPQEQGQRQGQVQRQTQRQDQRRKGSAPGAWFPTPGFCSPSPAARSPSQGPPSRT